MKWWLVGRGGRKGGREEERDIKVYDIKKKMKNERKGKSSIVGYRILYRVL